MNIRSFRQKYPEYNDMSDIQIADNLHKDYPEYSKPDFYKKFGIQTEQKKDEYQPLHKMLNSVLSSDSPVRDVAAGLLKNGKDIGGSLAEFMNRSIPQSMQKVLPYEKGKSPVERISPYEAMGTEESPIGTKKGNYQAAGEYAIPLGSAAPVIGSTIKGTGKLLKYGINDVLNTINPNKHAKSILEDFGKGKTLEEHGKDFASKIKSTYENVKKGISNKYDKFFEKNNLGEQELYPLKDITEKGGRRKATGGERYYRETPDFPSGRGSEEYQLALKNFNEKPNVKHAHELQSQLASEERMLNREIKSARARGENVKQLVDDLKLTKNSRKELLDKLHEKMGKTEAETYKGITKEYVGNVVPYHGNKNLRDIIFGDVTNPSSTNFRNIFKYADEDTKKILSHLGPDAKRNVVFQALGRNPENATHADLSKRINGLLESGFEHYVDPKTIKQAEKLGQSTLRRYSGLAAKLAGYTTMEELGRNLLK